jgi:hypothetical protein
MPIQIPPPPSFFPDAILEIARLDAALKHFLSVTPQVYLWDAVAAPG